MPWTLEQIAHALTGGIVEAKAELPPLQKMMQKSIEKEDNASPAINKDTLPGTALTKRRSHKLKLEELKLKTAEQRAMKAT